MKKLLAMLTSISTIGSIMPMILANDLTKIENNNLQVNNLKRNKRQTISTSDFLEENNKSITVINNINNIVDIIVFDNKDNIYFGGDEGIFILKQGSTTPTKINGISKRVWSIAIDSNNNVYIGTGNGLFILKVGETTATKIDSGDVGLILEIFIDSKDNVYFETNHDRVYILKQGETTPTKINGITNHINSIAFINNNIIYVISYDGVYALRAGEETVYKISELPNVTRVIRKDSKNNVYFGTDNGVYVLKTGETTATPINGTNGDGSYIIEIIIDSKDNAYFASKSGGFVLKAGETTATKIDGTDGRYINGIIIDSKDNAYFWFIEGVLVLRQNEVKTKRINGIDNYIENIIIDKNDNIYFELRDSSLCFLTHGEKSVKKIILEGVKNLKILMGTLFIIYNKNNLVILKDNEILSEKIIDKKIIEFYVKKNNDIYFSTLNSLFFLKNKTLIPTPINILNEEIGDDFKIDSKNNIYFSKRGNSFSVLKHNRKTSTLISGAPYIGIISIDHMDNIYFQVYDTANIIKFNESFPQQIIGVRSISQKYFFIKNNVYLSTDSEIYFLKIGETTATKLKGLNGRTMSIAIDKNNNVYFGTNNGAYVLKQGETTAGMATLFRTLFM